MNTIVLILLGILIIAALAFLTSLFRLPLEDADFWLKVISGVLAAFTFLAGAVALVTGHILGNRQTERVLTLERGNLELARTLEAERRTRVELEGEVARRTIGEQFSLVDQLKHLEGMTVVIVCVNDFEARGLAGQIAFVLNQARWKVVGPLVAQDDADVMEGVTVKKPVGMRPKGERSDEAAMTLLNVLDDRNVEARSFPELDPPLNTIKVLVGLKPVSYFLRPEDKERRKRQREEDRRFRDEQLQRLREWNRQE